MNKLYIQPSTVGVCLLLFFCFSFFSLSAQTVYLTSSGGSFANEKWMSITTGADGTGTLVWSQGNITPYPTGTTGGGLITDEAIDLTTYCGQTLYLNAYDRFADSWDNTTYSLEDAVSGGNVIIDNSGASPDDGTDADCSGGSWCDTDPASELEASEAFSVPCLCTDPAATFTLQTNCPNDFSVEVNVTATGDGGTVDITNNGGAAAINGVGVGTYTVGPIVLGTNVIVTVTGDGGCNIMSAELTEDCACAAPPTATINSANLDCTAMTYEVEVTVTSDGSGDANMSDIFIDGTLELSNATVGTLYTFSVAPGPHFVEVRAEGAGFASCTTDGIVNETCNGGDVCTDAVDITNGCGAGDLTAATVDGGALVENFLSCGNGTTIALCGANGGFTGSSYVRTDHTDVWYAVSPDGSDEITVTISNLAGGNLMVLPYLTDGTCPTSSADNTAMESNIDNFSTSLTNGTCPFFTSDGSITFQGNSLTTADVVYLRIMPFAPNGSGATNCETLTYPTFDICASVPLANDVCANAIDVTVNNGGAAATVNIGAASAENGNEFDCTGATVTEGDLWFEITYPDITNGIVPFNTTVTVDGPTGETVRLLLHDVTSACGSTANFSSTDVCEELTFASPVSTDFGGIETNDNNERFLQIIPVSGNLGNITVSAVVTPVNNTCEHFQNPLPGFDLTNFTDVNFTWSTDSGADPVTAGSDLWYQFSPNSGTDANMNVYSTAVDFQVGGLSGDQEVTILVYKGNTVSSNNCPDLTADYIDQIVVTSNGTAIYNCLDELHGPANGGYLVRVVQTGGSTVIDNMSLQAFPSPAGPFNNDCENIWNEASSQPAILSSANGTPPFNNPFLFGADGFTFLADDFEDATDCDDNITSSECNGVDNFPLTFNESDDRDLWFVFQAGAPPAAGVCDPTASTVIESMTFTYEASDGTRDGRLYVYSGCNDADLIACSPSLDGAPPGTSWTVSGLTQGDYYLLRAKPSRLNSDFEYSFDIEFEEGPVRPCNDDPVNAVDLTVDDCTDYTSLTTFSAQGASATAPVDGAPESDVWFKFTAPDPANGGSYTTLKSWVTVFFEATSGEGLFVELYNTSATQASGEVRQASGAGDQAWASFGNLNPGQEYFIRLYHKETVTTNVQYKIAVASGAAEEPGFGCGTNAVSNPAACSTGCDDLREQWFKIDLPDGTPGNAYWMIEVVGFDEHLDFELRSKYLQGNTAYNGCTGTEGALEGGCADFDHPCSSVALESAVSISSTTDLNSGADLTSGTAACDDGGTAATGQGTRRVYFNMNGAVAGQKDYYYLRVFMDPSDPNFATATDINICQLNFRGPYSTQALAEAGGTPDLNCTAAPAACPEISNISGDNTVESGESLNLTVSASNLDGAQLQLVRFDEYQTNPYTAAGGTVIATGASPLSSGAFTLPADGDYYVYALVTPQPTLADCTPYSLIVVSQGAGSTVCVTPTTGNTPTLDGSLDAGLYNHITEVPYAAPAQGGSAVNSDFIGESANDNNQNGYDEGSNTFFNISGTDVQQFYVTYDAGFLYMVIGGPNVCNDGIDLFVAIDTDNNTGGEVTLANTAAPFNKRVDFAGWSPEYFVAVERVGGTGDFAGLYAAGNATAVATDNNVGATGAGFDYAANCGAGLTEIRIPWSDLGGTPPAATGQVMNFAIYTTANDDNYDVFDTGPGTGNAAAFESIGDDPFDADHCDGRLDPVTGTADAGCGNTQSDDSTGSGVVGNPGSDNTTSDFDTIEEYYQITNIGQTDADPSATVTTTATVCDAASEAGNDEGQEDLDALVTAGDMTGTWTIISGNDGGTATITGTQAAGDVVFDAGTETGPFTVRYTITGVAPCPDETYDVTITRVDCNNCTPEVGVMRGN